MSCIKEFTFIEVKGKQLVAFKLNEYFTEPGTNLAANIQEGRSSFRDFLDSPQISTMGFYVNYTFRELRTTLKYSSGIHGISLHLAKSGIKTMHI